MSLPPILGYHLILSAYGFWLPNDPRGSWSDFVRAWELRRFGPATKVKDGRSRARDRHDVGLRLEAKRHLVRDPVHFTGLQARAIARGFARFAARSGIIIYACAILREHAHLVVARHRYSIEEIGRHLKGDATRQLSLEAMHPFANSPYRDGTLPTPWARHQWACFIDSHDYLSKTIDYVKRNPLREKMKEQRWEFVNPYLLVD
jgi:REP element-mobilizing transposase RayT